MNRDFYRITKQDTTPAFKKMKEEVTRFIVNTTDTSYGIHSNDGLIKIITGKHHFEETIPVMTYNYFDTEALPQPCVVVDLRVYLNSRVSQTDDLYEMVKDHTMVNYKINQAKLMLKFNKGLDGDIGNILMDTTTKVLIQALRPYFSFDPETAIRLHIIIMHYILTFRGVENEHVKISTIVKNMSYAKLRYEDVDDILKDINTYPTNINNMIENIKKIDLSGSFGRLDKNSFNIALSSLTTNMLMNKEIIAIVESPAIAASIFYTHIVDVRMKKTRLATMLTGNKRMFNVNELVDKVKRIVND